jgi:hypothetical protein
VHVAIDEQTRLAPTPRCCPTSPRPPALTS